MRFIGLHLILDPRYRHLAIIPLSGKVSSILRQSEYDKGSPKSYHDLTCVPTIVSTIRWITLIIWNASTDLVALELLLASKDGRRGNKTTDVTMQGSKAGSHR